MSVEMWKEWFINTCKMIFDKLPSNEVAIFYQTDSKIFEEKNCIEWIDKSFYVQTAATQSKCTLLFHKIYLLVDVGIPKFGRPSYSHMLAFSKGKPDIMIQSGIPDVSHRGDMTWVRGMGLSACLAAVKWAKGMGATTIVDPFCGHGSILAMANMHGLHAVGVELSKKRCKKARNITVKKIENQPKKYR